MADYAEKRFGFTDVEKNFNLFAGDKLGNIRKKVKRMNENKKNGTSPAASKDVVENSSVVQTVGNCIGE